MDDTNRARTATCNGKINMIVQAFEEVSKVTEGHTPYVTMAW